MSNPTLVAGVDCSVRSTTVSVCDAETGNVVRRGRAEHSDDTPGAWYQALLRACHGLLEGVHAISVAARPRRLVTLDTERAVLRSMSPFDDAPCAETGEALVVEAGGPKAWAEAVGSVPGPDSTVTRLRRFARRAPDTAKRVRDVMLPHDWLTWRLAGEPEQAMTDRGDASNTGYFCAATNEYRRDLVELAFGRDVELPEVVDPARIVGRTPTGAVVAAGTGHNMAAALGIGADVGDVVVSLGTRGTVFAVSNTATFDATGRVCGFADATGRHLPLVQSLNCSRVLDGTAALLGVDLRELDRLARAADSGAAGLTMLPYIEGERTPNIPYEAGSLHGMTVANLTPANLARAAVEGMMCGLADGVDAIREQGVPLQRVLLVGEAARSGAVREVAAGLFGVPVEVADPAEYVALGAARQAAWVLSGRSTPPRWVVESSCLSAGSTPDIRSRYSAAGLAAWSGA
ncbi:MAG TPA: xylulose kinase [Candidatus Stackebrandtia excrementipullorum]|nr:xylulose kinase [Candidatus Stackebrandtia excrementipullorum]